jgi:hypothetical protein
MLKTYDESLPSIRRDVEAQLRRALERHGIAPGSLLEDDLRGRIKVLTGYRGDVVIRAVDDTRMLVPVDSYVQQHLGGAVDSLPKRSTGPYRISKRDSELINATVSEIAAGEMIVDGRI